MNTPDHNVDQVTTESLEDLEVTNQQAEETKAGSGKASAAGLQTYLELELHG